MNLRPLTILLVLWVALPVRAQDSAYGKSDCGGCHGDHAEGGGGPALAPPKLSFEQFQRFVRQGSSNMPPYDQESLPDAQVEAMYLELKTPGALAKKSPEPTAPQSGDALAGSDCASCHGERGLGGAAKRIAGTALSYERFLKIVREGVGMMPATTAQDLPDEQVRAMYEQLRVVDEPADPIPITALIGQSLTSRNVAIFFFGVTLFGLVFAIRELLYYLRCAGWRELAPHVRKFGRGRAAAVFARAMVLEGLLVRSLWRQDRFRWTVHGLGLYGFLGLLLADVLIQIKNPTRAEMPDTDPAKMLALTCGAAVMAGIGYSLIRTRRDRYFNNGFTSRRDTAFIHLIAHTVFSGFLTMAVNQMSYPSLVVPAYLYHLTAIALLIGTAPFTRFSHAWVVPVLIGMTRVTEAVARSGADLGFEREPSPGRHHKSERVAESLLRQLGPGFEGPFKIRYYP